MIAVCLDLNVYQTQAAALHSAWQGAAGTQPICDFCLDAVA